MFGCDLRIQRLTVPMFYGTSPPETVPTAPNLHQTIDLWNKVSGFEKIRIKIWATYCNIASLAYWVTWSPCSGAQVTTSVTDNYKNYAIELKSFLIVQQSTRVQVNPSQCLLNWLNCSLKTLFLEILRLWVRNVTINTVQRRSQTGATYH